MTKLTNTMPRRKHTHLSLPLFSWAEQANREEQPAPTYLVAGKNPFSPALPPTVADNRLSEDQR